MMFLMQSPTLLLVLLLHGLSVSPLPSQEPVTHIRIRYVTGFDYDYDEDGETPPPSPAPGPPAATAAPYPPQPCEYDPCVAQEAPCSQISAQTGCLCPGLSGPGEPPRPPRLREVARDLSGAVMARWCAPPSTVTLYRVTVEGRRGPATPLVFGALARNGTLGGVEAGSRVCVEAENEAGLSDVSEDACARYEPPAPDAAALRAGVIAGGLGFLLLLSLAALLLWRRKMCGKGGRDDAEGLGNPSFSTDGTGTL